MSGNYCRYLVLSGIILLLLGGEWDNLRLLGPSKIILLLLGGEQDNNTVIRW